LERQNILLRFLPPLSFPFPLRDLFFPSFFPCRSPGAAGLKKAIVALARKDAVILTAYGVDGTEFRWYVLPLLFLLLFSPIETPFPLPLSVGRWMRCVRMVLIAEIRKKEGECGKDFRLVSDPRFFIFLLFLLPPPPQLFSFFFSLLL